MTLAGIGWLPLIFIWPLTGQGAGTHRVGKSMQGIVSRSDNSPADTLRVKVDLYHEHLIRSLVVSPLTGTFTAVTPRWNLMLETGKHYYATAVREGVLFVLPDSASLIRGTLRFTSPGQGSVMGIRPVSPFLPCRKYNGSIILGKRDGYLSVVNDVGIDEYLAGVAEAEAGPAAMPEFYKAQIILCRTYVIRNMERHGEQGANLCDGVHCQAYHGIPVWNEKLLELAAGTGGMILVDSDSVPVIAAYHSNSGGYTRSAGDVWLQDPGYLAGRRDDFSRDQRHSVWTRTIGFGEWTAYLRKKGFQLSGVISGAELEFNGEVPLRWYIVRDDSLSFPVIREDWAFPSDYFDIRYRGGMFMISGKGYGHGLGMSQEGAMNMATRKYTCREILDFYFEGTSVLDYRISVEAQ